MDYEALRADQDLLGVKGIFGAEIGVAFVEAAAFGQSYGPSEICVSTQDGCTVKLEPSGVVRVMTSVTDQGQGNCNGYTAQIVGDQLGVDASKI